MKEAEYHTVGYDPLGVAVLGIGRCWLVVLTNEK